MGGDLLDADFVSQVPSNVPLMDKNATQSLACVVLSHDKMISRG